MGNALLVENQHGGLLQIADPQAACGAEHLGADVISIDGIAACINIADSFTGKSQVDNRIINITHALEFGECEAGAFSVNTGNLAAHQPARQIKVMNTHINHQPAAVDSFGKLKIWATRVTTNRLEHYRGANGAFKYLLFGSRIRRIETAHESHLKFYTCLFDCQNGIIAGFHCLRNRFLAEDILAGSSGRHDNLGMCACWRGDHHCIHVF